jgi:nucleoside-diphosphate-sugar epimerase
MKIAIIGAAYTGLATAKYFKNLGHSISVTTTKESRREELEQVADKVTVMFGSDREKMKELLVDQDILVLRVAGGMVEKDGKPFMDLDLYKDAYVGTAESVVDAIGLDSSLRQIIFTSSLNAYGDGGGAEEISEDTAANHRH